MKNIFSLLMLAGLGTVASAQVLTNQPVNPTITNSNVLLDGSTNFSVEAGAQPYVGKGVIIPSVDLVNFQFDLTLADGATFPTMFDGMIVYNRSTGTTLTAGNRSSTATAVSPGYYYFYNPNGYNNQTVQPGVWRPLGGDPRVNIASAETPTNTSVNGNQIYAKRGTFTTNGTSTTPTAITNQTAIASPGSLYRITIYQSGTNNVYANSVYSYAADGTFVTGSPSMSVVYPQGTYNYTVEYTKTNN
ncbi:hypothetical protein [Chryseobacterium sp.]|uniref:hypothetical protein n=1 Tax=Chryseobacterium sp. TaxID=1871047 RepID=UPI002898AF51|nr:hypothetical protein [Chryseobacterium sp.]